jgi:hypothetical protein
MYRDGDRTTKKAVTEGEAERGEAVTCPPNRLGTRLAEFEIRVTRSDRDESPERSVTRTLYRTF